MFTLVLIFGRSPLSKSLKPCIGKIHPGLALDFPPGLGGGLLRVLGTGSALFPTALPPEFTAAKGGPAESTALGTWR